MDLPVHNPGNRVHICCDSIFCRNPVDHWRDSKARHKDHKAAEVHKATGRVVGKGHKAHKATGKVYSMGPVGTWDSGSRRLY